MKIRVGIAKKIFDECLNSNKFPYNFSLSQHGAHGFIKDAEVAYWFDAEVDSPDDVTRLVNSLQEQEEFINKGWSFKVRMMPDFNEGTDET